ncbi:MAG: DegT/DnrJ/EryC1/StrS family aminotransferase [Chitinophagaceae bacterium]|nr:DegT/DnrJ/EryC1/StrS family aminotransferase [Chitinophagaceae bacterium]
MIPYDNLGKVNAGFKVSFQQQFESFLDTGWYILGEGVNAFEQAFAAYHNTDFCIGVANGLDALVLSLQVLNLPKGSEIIVPANTYIASIISIIHAGHIPVLVEPDIKTYNIDPHKIEEAITSKTKAIMVVHLYGKCCEMDLIGEIASKYGLPIIEDCAQAHDATYKGQKAGTFGVLGAFSFYPSKSLGALGDAGAIITNNAHYKDLLKQLRNYGSHNKYYNDVIGSNSRLDELQALFLKIKLPYLEAITAHKRKLATLYREGLDDRFIKPVVQKDQEDVYHIFNIRYPHRDRLKTYLYEHGIGTEIHYPVAPHHQKALQPWYHGHQFPISEEIHATTLSLPCSYCHTKAEIMRVIEVINAFEAS